MAAFSLSISLYLLRVAAILIGRECSTAISSCWSVGGTVARRRAHDVSECPLLLQRSGLQWRIGIGIGLLKA